MAFFFVAVLQLFYKSRKKGMSPNLLVLGANCNHSCVCVGEFVLHSLGAQSYPTANTKQLFWTPRKVSGRKGNSFLLCKANLLFNFCEKNMLRTSSIIYLVFS